MQSPSNDARPFAIQLEVEFLDRLHEPVREGKAKSVSEIIRAALARFDLAKVVVVRPSQLIISVRLPTAQREELTRVAKERHTSVGQLVRAAVESFLPQLEAGTVNQMEIPLERAPAAAAPPPAAAAKRETAGTVPAKQRVRPRTEQPAKAATTKKSKIAPPVRTQPKSGKKGDREAISLRVPEPAPAPQPAAARKGKTVKPVPKPRVKR